MELERPTETKVEPGKRRSGCAKAKLARGFQNCSYAQPGKDVGDHISYWLATESEVFAGGGTGHHVSVRGTGIGCGHVDSGAMQLTPEGSAKMSDAGLRCGVHGVER